MKKLILSKGAFENGKNFIRFRSTKNEFLKSFISWVLWL